METPRRLLVVLSAATAALFLIGLVNAQALNQSHAAATVIAQAPHDRLAAATVGQQRLTRDPGGTCATPTAADYFLTTDDAVYVWFIVTDGAQGDLGRDEWYDPQGKLIKQAAWAPLTKAGSFCMWARFEVIDRSPKPATGTWEVRVSWNGERKFSLRFPLLEKPPAGVPYISANGVVNGADFTGALSPGTLFSIFGDNLAASLVQAGTSTLPSSLAGTAVEIVDGDRTINTPLVFVSKQQVNGQLPYGLRSQRVRVRVRTASGITRDEPVAIQAQSPRLYTAKMTGRGEAIAFHGDFRPVTKAAPLQAGEAAVVYGTGFGAVTPELDSGQPAPDGTGGTTLRTCSSKIEVEVGGKPAVVAFAGLTPGLAGLYQLNFLVPPGLSTSTPGLTVRSGQAASPAISTYTFAENPNEPWEDIRHSESTYWVFILERVDIYCRDLNGENYRCASNLSLDNALTLIPPSMPHDDTFVERGRSGSIAITGGTIEIAHFYAPCVTGLCSEVRKTIRLSAPGLESETSVGFTFVDLPISQRIPGQIIFSHEGADLGNYVHFPVLETKRTTPQEHRVGQFERIEYRPDSRLTVTASHDAF